ncbi:MAG TPA: sulfatase [Tepidisphaeraceae bacterium]|nr:sulfatase [Tepidisphaeraceae bacterium]
MSHSQSMLPQSMLWPMVAALLTLAIPAPAADAPQGQRRPNVVVFLADDLGARDLGCTGSTFYESPNVDALAKRGAVFTQAYAACPVCSPTRAAILTGRYPARVGITDWIGAVQPQEVKSNPRWKDKPMLPAPYKEHLPLEEVTLAEAMCEAGYATCFLGKWHLGAQKFMPHAQGFDASIGATHRGSPGKNGYLAPYNDFITNLAPGPEGEHLDLRLANEAAQWIAKRDKDRPFLLYFSLYDVHTPLMAPPATIRYFEEKKTKLGLADAFDKAGDSKLRLNQAHPTYAAMVKTMDDAVGIVVKQLEAQGMLDDTIIVFTSDNGGLSTTEGSPTSNAPLRAGKGWPYEGGVRVPQVMVVPGVTSPGSTTHVLTTSTDLFPTLLGACGLPARGKDHADGVNLLPALKNQALPNRPLFWHYPHYGNQGGSPFSAVRSGDWKLIAFHDPNQPAELYNLSADPSETKDLAAEHPDRVASLRQTLNAWKRAVGAVDSIPNTP